MNRDCDITNLGDRDILEQGINLLRYGLQEKDIDAFIEACLNNGGSVNG